MLKSEEMVFSRGEDGNLIPQIIELESLPDKPQAKVKPLTRGKLQEIHSLATGSQEEKVKADLEILREGLVEPKMTDEQLQDLKPVYANALITAILAVSLDTSQEQISNQTTALQIDSLKKN